jgi:glycosyltransferase involved in cell wall biosynthesis
VGTGAPALTHPPVAATRPHALFLINDLRMGGAERSLINFVNHAQRVRPSVVLIESAADLVGDLSEDLDVYSLEKSDPSPLSDAELGAARDAAAGPRQGRPLGRTALELPALMRKAWVLAHLARRTNAAIVSTFLNRSHTIALLAKMVFAPRMRIAINVHEMLSDHLGRFFSPLERRFMQGFVRHAFPRAEIIIAVSEGVKQDLVRHFSIPPERIVVLPNPVDLERIRRLATERVDDDVPRDGATIVAAGRLVQLKGFDLLIRAFARLRPSLHARLLIVGEGDQRAALESLIGELHLSDRVALLGTRANPWKYMARADVVALASRSEAFPNVIGEALALGRPVIATECSPGVAEYLDRGRYGVLVPPNDVDALAAGLDRILTDDELRRQLAARAPSRVESFALSRIVERYESLLLAAGRP